MTAEAKRIPVRFMTVGEGNAKDKHRYGPEAVAALVPLIKAQPRMFLDHSLPSEVRERGHRSLTQLAGIAVRESVHYDPALQATVGEVVLRPRMAEFVALARETGVPIGVSVDAVGNFRVGPTGDKECTGWDRFHSADFVPQGGAGGFTLDVREADSPALQAAEREFVMGLFDDVTPKDVRETASDLYEAIGKEYVAAHPAPTAGTSAPPVEVERLVRENAALAARVDAMEAEKNREQSAQIVSDTIKAQGQFTPKQTDIIAQQFKGVMIGATGPYTTPDLLVAAVRESATAHADAFLSGATGYITGMGPSTTPTGASGEAVRESAQGTPKPDDIGKTLEDWVGGSFFGRKQAAGASGNATTP